jgi:hypothetical protein
MARDATSSGNRRGGERPGDIHGVQGEGNKEADRRYREAATRFAESGRVEDASREAADSVEGEGEGGEASPPASGERGGRER